MLRWVLRVAFNAVVLPMRGWRVAQGSTPLHVVIRQRDNVLTRILLAHKNCNVFALSLVRSSLILTVTLTVTLLRPLLLMKTGILPVNRRLKLICCLGVLGSEEKRLCMCRWC